VSRYSIRAQGLSKRFHLGHRNPGRGLHEAIERFARSPWRLFAPSREQVSASAVRSGGAADGAFWALRDVSFECEPGVALGVLGPNGAGKSVLLKILSRVTAPTLGSAEIRGHVAPLLEVGTGFHPELTGRQNVYFNGAILGMSRDRIRKKFDEIVAFSEIEPFIDNPVKLYSGGMRMRLAFSVAAHLEPEILLIDEALSVGDASFRAKCRRKIAEFVAHGCTLLLVSHDPTIIAELCDRAIRLEHGRMVDDAGVADVLRRYQSGERQ
jgi:lipopolysaccharide transport system ATP-binding protein